jgi:heme exporter protein D
MNFQFDSVSAFFEMNGHGGYVWAAYAITYTVLIYLAISPLLQKKAFLRQQKKIVLLQNTTQQ